MPGEDPKPDRFEWPPHRVPASELNLPAQPLDAGGYHRLVSRSRLGIDEDAVPDETLGADVGGTHPIDFDEPEYDVGDLAVDEDSFGAAVDAGGGIVLPSPTRGIARWIEAFEIAYLGRVSASWDVRARDAGWRADEESDYCPRCGLSVGEFGLDTLTDPPTCAACRDRRLPWDRYVRLGLYRGVLAGAIRDLKFNAMRAHGASLGAALGEKIAATLRSMGVREDRCAIVPVPMTPWRRIARGVDHAATIAAGVSKMAGVPIVRALWRRHRPAQWSVPTSQRRRNVSGSFGVRGSWSPVGLNPIERLRRCDAVIVVDDVRTTGATMSEACRVIGRTLDRANADNSPIIIASSLAVASIRPKPA